MYKIKEIKKIIKIILLFIIFIGINTVISKAAIRTNDPTATTNSTVSITVTSTEALENFDMNISNCGGLTFSSVNTKGISNGTAVGFMTINEPTTTLGTYTFKTPSTPGDYKVTFVVNGVSNTSTVKVTEPTQNTQQTENQSNSTTKSSVATLKNLGIKPNDFSGFSAGKTSYSVTVPNDVESVELYATKGQGGQKITGTGNKTLKEGSNTFAIKVTAEDGKTTKTYTVNITRQTSAESTENKNETEENQVEEGTLDNTEKEEVFGLKELKVQGFDLTPEFKTDIYEYSVKLIGDQDKLDLSVLATEEKANVEITGNENLQEGDNLITITVVDESGEKAATYQVTVNKSLVDKDALAKHERNKMNIIIVCSITGLITITLIIIYLVKRKKSDDYDDYSYEKEIPYANLNKELEEEKKVQEDDVQEEKKEKKKHSKGKRFK